MKRRSVLNGRIFSIFGLYDAALLNQDKYKDKLEKTVQTLADNLEKYDMKFWTKYDQSGNVASPAYHDLHIKQMKIMYELFGEQRFLMFAQKCEKYQKNALYKGFAVFIKAQQKIFSKSEMVITK